MKLGMIFECGPQGADKQVCEYLARHLRGNNEIASITLDTKANLLRDAGATAKQLLADGCCCVLIIWDLRPAWPNKKKACRANECGAVMQALRDAEVGDAAPVHLICVEQELESWLLANDRAASALLSTDTHKYVVKRTKKPDRIPQPKAVLINHFKSARGWRYDDKIHAIRILRAAPVDLIGMRKSASFDRFEQKLLDC